MERSLADYLDLTVEQARAQWGRILGRVPRPRQEHFTPVETILCYGLFFGVDHRRYGSSTAHRAPEIVHTLARLFERPSSSVLAKMANLDGSRSHGAKYEWQLFVHLATEPDRFPHLYNVVLRAARDMGIDARRLPDFLALDGLQTLDLLGQEELSTHTFETVVELRAAHDRLRQHASPQETTRLVEQRARLGQHRFASDVLANYDHSCGFCGFAPRSIRGNRLLVASHIKPWADSTDDERLDPTNGIAACPTHDAAFDTGLITVNGGLRVHRSSVLENATLHDARVDRYFGDALEPVLLLPGTGKPPNPEYLDWHHEHIYQGAL